ncbi:MAG: ABC transporter permease subunit [Planctomycetota bacterium]
MVGFIAKRLLSAIPLLGIIVTVNFFVMRIIPGGPFDRERPLPPEVRLNLEKKYHLNEPLFRQYLYYLGDLARGDLGLSMKYTDSTVNEVIAGSLPNSMALGALALALSVAAGVAAGVAGAAWSERAGGRFLAAGTTLGVCIPSFVIGPLLVLVFARTLGWFDVQGWGEPRKMVLPVLALSGYYTAYIARLTRAGILEEFGKDYVRTARAKGLSWSRVLIRHVLKNGITPVVSYLGPATAAVLTGSVVVEKIFNIPGIGRDFVSAPLNRDYTLVMGVVLVYSLFLIFFNLLSEVALGLLDPRVRK